MGDLEGLGFWYLAQYILADDDDDVDKPSLKKPTYENPFGDDDDNDDDDDDEGEGDEVDEVDEEIVDDIPEDSCFSC